jgi:histidine triad (HIT) family protein
MNGKHGADDCTFCQILAGRKPAYLVYEDQENAAFLDIMPFNRGHTLIVPRRHVHGLIDLQGEERHSFISAVANVCHMVEERISPHYNIACNRGEPAGQVVFHLHFHVIPRFGEGREVFSRRLKFSDQEFAEIQAELSGKRPRSSA